MEIFLKFNKIQQLTNNIHDLRKALKKSEFLGLSEDKTKVFRNTPVKEKSNVDACTIYVEQLSCDADHDWLKLIFSRYGKVVSKSKNHFKSFTNFHKKLLLNLYFFRLTMFQYQNIEVLVK